MKNSVRTKAAFISSLVSLILCFSMLLGTTYAWFTKTVTSTNNVIQSGNLTMDVELCIDEAADAWVSVKSMSDEPIFGDNYIWQPGISYTKYFRVSNIGNLSLKWQASLVKAVHSSLDPSVSPYINITVTNDSPDEVDASDILIQTELSTIEEFVYGTALIPEPYLASGSLEPVRFDDEGNLILDSDYDYFAVTLSMANNAPMEIAGRSLGEFDLRVVATQETSPYEEDSFGGDYDASTFFPDPVGTGEQLEAIFNTLSTHGAVTLDRDYDLKDFDWTPLVLSGGSSTQFTINGDGHTIKNLNVNGTNSASLIAKLSGGAKLVINDLTIEDAVFCATETDAEGSAAAFVGFFDGSADSAVVTLTNCHVKNTLVSITNETDGGFAGTFIGYNSGKNVFLTSCTAENVVITSAEGSAGGVIGHSSGLTANDITLSEISVENTSDRSEKGSSKAGIFAGTVNGKPVTVQDLTYNDCTAVQNGLNDEPQRLVGRFVNGAVFVLEDVTFTE